MEKIGYYSIEQDGAITAQVVEVVKDHINSSMKTIDFFSASNDREALTAFEQRGVNHIKFKE